MSRDLLLLEDVERLKVSKEALRYLLDAKQEGRDDAAALRVARSQLREYREAMRFAIGVGVGSSVSQRLRDALSNRLISHCATCGHRYREHSLKQRTRCTKCACSKYAKHERSRLRW